MTPPPPPPPPIESSSFPSIDFDQLGWDELGKLAKTTENELDGKLLSLGRLTSSALRHQRYERPNEIESPIKQAEKLVLEIQDLLGLLNRVVDALSSRAQEMGSTSLHILQRHRDLLTEYSKEFRKTKDHLNNAKEHAELVSSVREEIRSYRTVDPKTYLLSEREHIDNARSNTDHIIHMAYNAQSGVHQQRSFLSEANRKMGMISDRFPIINQIMLKVRVRRNRDTLILVFLVALLLLFSYYWVIRH